MKKLLVILGILAVLGAGAVFGVIKLIGSIGDEFKPLVATFLKDQPYDMLAPELKKIKSPEGFQEDFRACKAVLGDFQQVGSMSGFQRHVNNGVSTGEITVGLAYSKGETSGTFKFVKQNDVWKIYSYHVSFPDALLPKPNKADLESPAKGLIEKYNASEFVALYEGFSPELKKAWPAEKFQSDMQRIRGLLGSIVDAQPGTFEEDTEGMTLITKAVSFEKGQKGIARFKFLWRNHSWQLLGFWIKES